MIAPPQAQNDTLTRRYEQVRTRLRQAVEQARRMPVPGNAVHDTDSPVRLLAVSKGHPASAIAAMAALGQRAFGENYLQQALEKIAELRELELEWHYIGALQSNKTRAVAEHFSWVQSVDRLKLAQRLSEQRPPSLPPLQVLLQVNIDNEPQKAGVAPAETLALAQAVTQLPRLQLRGLMGLPKAQQNVADTQDSFRRLAQLFTQVQALGPAIDTLSMGMSDDLEQAVAAGSTMIRVGTALFGPRPAPPGDSQP